MPYEYYVAAALCVVVLLGLALKGAITRWMSNPITVNVIIGGHLAYVNLGTADKMASEAIAYVKQADDVDVDPATALRDVRNQGSSIRKQLEKAGQWEEALKRFGKPVDDYVIYLIGCGFWAGVLALLHECSPETYQLVYGTVPSEHEHDEKVLEEAEAIRDLLAVLETSESLDDQARERAGELRSYWASVFERRERAKAWSRS